jgi:hypothetical protein
VINLYTIEQAEEWDEIVRSFLRYDVYWLSGYVKAFHYHGDGDPLLFHYERDGTRGINVVMKSDVSDSEYFKNKIKKGAFFDFATPYGYGGWLIEGSGIDDLFESYDAWLRENGVVSEFVRFHPMIENHISVNVFYKIVYLGDVVHIDLLSPEYIWNNFTSKNRNVIRKAMKNNIRVYNGRYRELFKQFRTIYNKTMDKEHADKYYYFGESFYKSILDDLPQNAEVFYAEKDNSVIAAAIILFANGRMNYHLSGSLREYNSLAPTNLLLYKAALWGHANGYKTFYLGGGLGAQDDSLFRFKRAFNKGALNGYYIGEKIVDQDRYNELVALRGVLPERSFFPQYRL